MTESLGDGSLRGMSAPFRLSIVAALLTNLHFGRIDDVSIALLYPPLLAASDGAEDRNPPV